MFWTTKTTKATAATRKRASPHENPESGFWRFVAGARSVSFLEVRVVDHAATLHSNRVLDRLRSHRTLATTVAVYFAGFLILGVATSNPQVPFYAGFMAVTLGAVVLWDARAQLSELALWGLALWGALHMAGGMVPIGEGEVLYNLWFIPFVRFDHVVHAIGFGFAGLAFSDALGRRAPLALMGGLGFGALNEMVEFLITRVVPDTNIGGFENTGWDLVANAVGAILAALWVRFRVS